MTRRAPTFHGPNTWIPVRDAYLSGLPAKVVCERFGVGEDARRQRAKREGWTCRVYALAADHPPPLRHAKPVAASATSRLEANTVDTVVEPVAPAEAARRALADGAAAMAAGDYGRAATVLKTVETLARLLAAHPTLDPDRSFAEPAERPFTPIGDVIEILAERFGVEAKP